MEQRNNEPRHAMTARLTRGTIRISDGAERTERPLALANKSQMQASCAVTSVPQPQDFESIYRLSHTQNQAATRQKIRL